MASQLTLPGEAAAVARPLAVWPDGAPVFRTLVDLFRRAVASGRDAPCVSFGGAVWTYREIDQWSDAIAASIDERCGSGGQTRRAGLLVERGPQMLAGILGVLKSGHPFVPVDPAQPIERSRLILEDAQPALIVTDLADFAHRELGIAPERIVDARQPAPDTAGRPSRACDIDAFAPAYVTYTSGSTGRPKGVICTHAGACNLADILIERYSLTRDARVAATASIGFDASLGEICLALRAGAMVVVAAAEATRSGVALAAFLRNEQISHLLVTPTLLAAVPREPFPDLKLISVGGEPTPQPLIEYWSRRLALDNAFGPTETSIEVSHWRFSPGEPGTLIGRPIRNARFDVRNETGERAEEGELWIGGPMVALGYVGGPEMTRARFVVCPETGLRFYRSGDRVRRIGDGVYDFLGRIDEQIKISGVRIEPAEVRLAIEAVPGVLQAAVCTEQSDAGTALVAYYTAFPQGLDRATLITELSRRLQSAMIPARLIEVDAIPMLPSGKIDVDDLKRRAAPPKVAVATSRPSAVSRAVTELWRKLLNVSDVKLTDNFFELGGDSLRLTQLIFTINKTYRVKLTPAAFRTLDDLGALIAHVEAALASQGGGTRRPEPDSAANAFGGPVDERGE
jgi:amino acid adenylation domain-containing protein